MSDLCEYELEVLTKVARGETQQWGAAVGQALEFLQNSGYLDRSYQPTAKGLAAIVTQQETK